MYPSSSIDASTSSRRCLARSGWRRGLSRLGELIMPAIVANYVVRQVGEKRARDLLMTGRVFEAEEALRLGLVNEIAPADKLMSRARELAASLIELSPTSLAFTKRLLGKFVEAEVDRDLELAVAESSRIRATPDFREGLQAFLGKRKPVWRGE